MTTLPTHSSIRWMPVEHGLPDDDTLVLIALDCGEVWPAVRDGGRWIYASGCDVSERVTHWTHLPPAPVDAA